jgi:hypothetical protein
LIWTIALQGLTLVRGTPRFIGPLSGHADTEAHSSR